MSAVQRINILIVDDEPSNLFALEAILEPLGQKVIRANSGAEALREVLEKDFAVILLDVQMPGMDGFEAAAMIRERDRSRHIPIIFLTGIGRSNEWASRGYLAGAIDYLVKPVIPDFLRAKVEIFVELANARHQLQEEMAERARVAQEVQQLNRVLREKNRELMEANADLSAFNHTVSHDLQTPLRHVQGYIGLLDRTVRSRLTEDELRKFDAIRTAAARMSSMVDDLLSFCRLGRTSLKRESVDMDALVAEVIASLQPDLQDRAVTWDVGELNTGHGDRALLRQVWANLMGNAVKYTSGRERTEISLSRWHDGAETIYCIRDNGVGFDMKHVQRLFGVFERLHSEGEFSGSGIGLATVRRIIERHHGRIWAEGTVGVGASFYFTLPDNGATSHRNAESVSNK